MKTYLALLAGAMTLSASAQSFSWDTKCSYGSFDENQLACTVSDVRSTNDATRFYQRPTSDIYLFTHSVSEQVNFVEGSAVEIRLDDGAIEPLGEIRTSASFTSRGEAYSSFEVVLTTEVAENLIQRMVGARVLRLNVATKGESNTGHFYSEIPLLGFSDAINTLTENTL